MGAMLAHAAVVALQISVDDQLLTHHHDAFGRFFRRQVRSRADRLPIATQQLATGRARAYTRESFVLFLCQHLQISFPSLERQLNVEGEARGDHICLASQLSVPKPSCDLVFKEHDRLLHGLTVRGAGSRRGHIGPIASRTLRIGAPRRVNDHQEFHANPTSVSRAWRWSPSQSRRLTYSSNSAPKAARI